MIGRTRRLENQLDAALEGRAVGVPDELLPLLAAADDLRAAAMRIEPDHALARQRIDRALRPEGRVAQLPRSEPRWGMRLVVTAISAAAAIIPATVASTSSVPGDPLYALKRGIEQVRVIAATSPEAEAATRTDIAFARLAELDALLANGDFEHIPQVLMDLRAAMGEASEAVAIAREQGADSTQVAALESQLAGVGGDASDHINQAMDTLPPEKAEELQTIIETVTTESTAPPKGGGGRGSDELGPTPTSPPPTTAGSGSGIDTDGPTTTEAPPTSPPTTATEPTTTEAPPTTSGEPQPTSTPAAGGP